MELLVYSCTKALPEFSSAGQEDKTRGDSTEVGPSPQESGWRRDFRMLFFFTFAGKFKALASPLFKGDLRLHSLQS